MARKTAPPTGTPCRTAEPRKHEHKLFDGGGLDLLVQPNGRKGGRLRYVKPDGREGLTALSSYPVIRLFHCEETGALDSAAALIAFGFAAFTPDIGDIGVTDANGSSSSDVGDGSADQGMECT